jgi:hypothetical protein
MAIADELDVITRTGVMPHRWNGVTEREKLSSQRNKWSHVQKSLRDSQLSLFDDLTKELDIGNSRNQESLDSEKGLLVEVKDIRAMLKLEKRPDLKVELDGKLKEVEAGKVGRRQWAVRKKEITTELKALKDNGLAGARVNGRRKSDRPSGDTSLVNKDPDMLVPTAVDNDEGPSNPIVLGDHFERMPLPFLI